MTMLLSDQPARELISSTGLDRTLFVEAGAGTGKTTQLVSRIVNTVLNNDVRLSEIAAITFTEAAASELQARIRVEFEKLAQTQDPTHRERAEQAIADTDLAAVSTVQASPSASLASFRWLLVFRRGSACSTRWPRSSPTSNGGIASSIYSTTSPSWKS